MTQHYAYPHIKVKAEMHRVSGYHSHMLKKRRLAVILAENAKAFRINAEMTQPQVSDAARMHGHRIDQGTISRVERRALMPSIDVLEALAAGLDVQAWQLLVDGANPKNPPVLREPSAHERELWRKLEEAAEKLGITR